MVELLGADNRIRPGAIQALAAEGRLDDMDKAFVNATREATAAALRVKLEDGESDTVEAPLSKAHMDLLRRSQKFRRTEVKRLALGLPRSQEVRNRYKEAGRIIALFDAKLRRKRAQLRAKKMMRMAAADPKRFARDLRDSGTDSGLPHDTRCALMNGITDKDGRLISDDPQEIEEELVRFWQESFRISDKLSNGCVLNVAASLEALQQFGKQLREEQGLMEADAPAAVRADDALGGIRSSGLRDRVAAAVAEPEAAQAAKAKGAATIARGEAVKTRHRSAWQRLQRAFGDEELLSILPVAKDTGAGVDGGPLSSLRYAEDAVRAAILIMLNTVFSSGKVPSTWDTGRLIMHYKGKNAPVSAIGSYRPLGVGAMMGKLYSLLLMKRLEEFVEATDALHWTQGGFRPRRGTQESVFSLFEAVRSAAGKQNARMTYLLFVDLENAYGSIDHSVLWDALIGKGIDGKFLATVISMYSSASATLDVGGQLVGASMTDGGTMKGSIEIQRGVLQGSPISPLLFNLFIDSVIRSVHDDDDEDTGIPLPRVDKGQAEPWPRAGPLVGALPVPAAGPGAVAPAYVPCDRCGLMATPQALDMHRGSKACTRLLNDRVQNRVPRGMSGSQISSRPGAGPVHDYRQDEVGERLRSAWYADDGAAIARTHAAMQRMIEKLMDRFAALGLVLNAGKTYVLMVPPLTWSESQYHVARDEAIKLGFFARRSNETGGTKIKVVDKFTYLGVEVTWRWDWAAAWKAASSRAWRMYHILRNGGLGNAEVSMASMLHAVKSLIFCHLDAVAAVAGSLDDAAMDECERVVTASLVMVTAASKANKIALRFEAGIWDFRTRVQMLQLRFACKTATADAGTLQGRAFALSRARLRSDEYAMQYPVHAYKESQRTRSWAQGVAAAARRFDVGRTAAEMVADPRPTLEQAIFDGKPGAALATIERATDAGGLQWVEVASSEPDVAGQKLRLRSIFVRASARDYVTGLDVSSWELPAGSLIGAVYSVWSPSLRQTVKVSLKSEGNTVRQRCVRDQLRDWSTKTLLRDYVMWKRSSYLESYWFCSDLAASRRLLRARLGCWGDEWSTRYKPMGVLPEVLRHERACYLCAEDEWMPESLEHLVLSCQHTVMAARRVWVRTKLTALAAKVAATVLFASSDFDVLSKLPDFSDDGTLMVILMCGTSHSSVPPRRVAPVAVPPVNDDGEADMGTRRLSYDCIQYSDAAVEAIQWMSALTAHHRRALSVNTADTNRLAPLAGQLIDIVTLHSLDLWRRRGALLARDGCGFALRTRDPPEAREKAAKLREKPSAAPVVAPAAIPAAAPLAGDG